MLANLKNNMVANLLAFAGIAIALIALFRDNDLVTNWTVLLFGLYILILAALLVWREYTYARKARYAEASHNLHRALHVIRDAFDLVEENNKAAAKNKIRDALNFFASALTLITGANCRVCIKEIRVDEAENDISYQTATFCRHETDRLAGPKDGPQPIRDNSDFFCIFSGEVKIYFSNNLAKENPYLNSNWPKLPTERKEFIKTKKYDYISSIVWPIQGKAPVDVDNGDENSGSRPVLVGFLCADSMTRGIFSPRYDKEIGAMLADALYPLLLKYREKFATNPSEE